MSFYITKYSGQKELFDIHKFRRSLKRSGASSELIETLINELQNLHNIRTTHDIYEFAFARLREENPAVAAHYNLKKALFELGPSGFPFEKFVALIFKAQKYQVETDQIVKGKCVDHEIDIVGSKEKKTIMVECKFHNQQGIKSDVKVPLYVKARFDDVEQKNHLFHEAWLVSNTKFTTQAIEYAECAQIKLMSFSYPSGGSIAELIDKYQLHPITALSSLTLDRKKELISHGLVLCKDAEQHKGLLKQLGFTQQEIDTLITESQKVCKLTPMPNNENHTNDKPA
jgi:restriction endonuclease